MNPRLVPPRSDVIDEVSELRMLANRRVLNHRNVGTTTRERCPGSGRCGSASPFDRAEGSLPGVLLSGGRKR